MYLLFDLFVGLDYLIAVWVWAWVLSCFVSLGWLYLCCCVICVSFVVTSLCLCTAFGF